MITITNRIQETELLDGYTQTDTGSWYLGSEIYPSSGPGHTYYVRATIQSTGPSHLNLTLWQNRPRAPMAVGHMETTITTKPYYTTVSLYGGPEVSVFSHNMANLIVASDADSGVSNTISVKECMLIDLNECFPDSFELPTKDWCDRLPFVRTTYQINDWYNINGGYVKLSNSTAVLHNLVTDSSLLNGTTKTVTRIYDGVSSTNKYNTGNHIMYLRSIVSSTNTAGLMLRFWDGSGNFIIQSYPGLTTYSTETTISVRDRNNGATFSDVSYQSIVDGISNTLTIRNTVLIDLTADFGAGNEPSKEWCDENIPYFTGTHNPWGQITASYIKTANGWVQGSINKIRLN